MYFSVIIPIYNAEAYLRECVESVLNQTFSDFEVILVDDGSTDTSGQISDEYESKDKRVSVIHKQNGGQSTARNQGICIARGKYLLFLDSDDFINSASFMEELYKATKNEVDVVAFRYLKFYTDHSSDCGIKMNGLDGLNKVQLISELVRRDAFFCSCWSKTVNTDLVKRNNIIFDESLSCEDMDWYLNIILNINTIRVIDTPFISYRQREGSVTSGGYKEKNLVDYISTIKRWKKRLEALPDNEEKTALLSALGKLYCNLLISFSRYYVRAKNHAKEIYEFKELLKWDLNPRTKLFHRIASVIGIRGLILSIRIIDKFQTR